MSLTAHLDNIPPCLCRIAARDPKRIGRRLSIMELSAKSGLSYGATRRLSLKKTWGNTPPVIIDKFAGACGVDLLHPKRTIEYLKRALKSPNGYKNLSAKTGRHSPKAVMEMLKGLRQ